jgi:glycerol-3-phosphate acyltransferase PlsY
VTRPCPARIALIGLPSAFALGCIPSARLIARLVGAADITSSGDRKPGAANVARTLGWKPGAATLSIDLIKGSAGVGTARVLGAGPTLAGALALTPVVAHVTVVRGRGAATALGAALALDPLATAAVLPAVVGGALARRAALGAMVAALGLPVASLALDHRCRAVWAAGLPGIMAYARLRGSDGVASARDPRVSWERFWFDREPDAGAAASGAPGAPSNEPATPDDAS